LRAGLKRDGFGGIELVASKEKGILGLHSKVDNAYNKYCNSSIFTMAIKHLRAGPEMWCS
jgi:hypothetical protein